MLSKSSAFLLGGFMLVFVMFMTLGYVLRGWLGALVFATFVFSLYVFVVTKGE